MSILQYEILHLERSAIIIFTSKEHHQPIALCRTAVRDFRSFIVLNMRHIYILKDSFPKCHFKTIDRFTKSWN